MNRFLLLLCTCWLSAQTISVQGVLRGSSNQVVPDDTYTMEFQIYDSVSGGSPLWSSSSINADVVNGIYSTDLDIGDLNGDELWLQTTVNGETMADRTRVYLPSSGVEEGGDVSFNSIIAVITDFNNSIDADDIANDAVGSSEIAAGAVGSSEIASDAVDDTKIANESISSEHYIDGSVHNAHIGDDQVNSEHYADGSIDSNHLAANSVGPSALHVDAGRPQGYARLCEGDECNGTGYYECNEGAIFSFTHYFAGSGAWQSSEVHVSLKDVWEGETSFTKVAISKLDTGGSTGEQYEMNTLTVPCPPGHQLYYSAYGAADTDYTFFTAFYYQDNFND